MNKRNRYAVAVIGFFFWCAAVADVSAESYPDRTIRLVVPNAAGGLVDLIGRVVADEMSKRMGQPVIIENRPGADTMRGVTSVAKSEADGYTLLFSDNSAFNVVPQMNKVSYDMFQDFIPVGVVLSGGGVLLSAYSGTPFSTVDQLVEFAKKNPGKINYASATSLLRLPVEMLQQAAGISLTYVPYRAAVQTFNDTIAGRIELVTSGANSVRQHYELGNLKPLAVSSVERLKSLPKVPTFIEVGYPDVLISNWFGVFAPKGTSPAIIAALEKQLSAIAESPAMKTLAVRNDSEAEFVGGDALRKRLSSDYARLGRIIEKAGLSPSSESK